MGGCRTDVHRNHDDPRRSPRVVVVTVDVGGAQRAATSRTALSGCVRMPVESRGATVPLAWSLRLDPNG